MHILLCLGKVYNWGVCRFAHGHALPLGEMHFPFQILVFLLAIWCKSLVRMVAVKIGWKQWWTHEKWNKEEKGRTPYEKIKRTNTLGHVTKATWCGNFQEKCPDQNLGAHFALKKKKDIDCRSTLTDVFVFDSFICDIKWDTIGIWMNLSIYLILYNYIFIICIIPDIQARGF